MAKAVFEVRVRKLKGPLFFSVYMDTAGKALALVKSFDGDDRFIATTDPNQTRVVFDNVLEAYETIVYAKE